MPAVVVGSKCHLVHPRYRCIDDSKVSLHTALEHWDTAGKQLEHPAVLQMIVHLL